MNGFKSFMMIFLMLISANASATELGQQLLMDQDSYDEDVADKTNYKDVKTAARDFCANEFTNSSTYADAPPPGIIFACNNDALAEMFVSWFDYPRLEKMFALNGGEKDNAGKMAEALGFDTPTLKTINISKDNIVVWKVINTVLNYFIGIIFLFTVFSFFNEARKLNSEFGLQNSMDAVVMSMKKQWIKIIAFIGGAMMLTTFPIYIVILLSGMVNFGAYLFFDPADEQGLIDKTKLKPLKDSEAVNYGNFMLRSALEGNQTAEYFLSAVDYQSEIDKNWSPFNYDDPTKEQVFHFVEGVKGAFNAQAEMDSVWFSNLTQVESFCFGFDDTYEYAGLNMLFGFVDNDNGINCINPKDKTDFSVLVPGSKLAGVGIPGVDLLLQGASEYMLSIGLGDSLAVAIEKGNAAGQSLVGNYDEVFAMARTSIDTGADVYSTAMYEALVLDYAGILAPAIKNVNDEDLEVSDQQILKALMANTAKEAMMGFQIQEESPVPSDYATGNTGNSSSSGYGTTAPTESNTSGGDKYGEHSDYLINQYKNTYARKWYEYVMAENCSLVSNKEVVYQERMAYVNKFNSYGSGEVYNEISSDGRTMSMNSATTDCIVYNADGTKKVLGASTEEEFEEIKKNRVAAELAMRLVSSIAFDASIEAYNQKIAEDSFAKEELVHFKRGFYGLFLNLQERAKNKDKLARLNKAYNHYSFEINGKDMTEYEENGRYDYVLQKVVGNYDPSTKTVRKMIVPDIERSNIEASMAVSDVVSDSNIRNMVVDFFFEDYFYECVNPVGDGSGYACADPTYMQVLLTAPKAIPQSIEIITIYLVVSVVEVAADTAGTAIKASGVGAAIAFVIEALAGIIQFIMIPLYYIALYIMLMSIIGLILTSFVPISIIIDVMYSVLYFVFGMLLLLIYVLPFSALLGRDDEVQNVLKKILIKLIEPVFTVSIIIFYYFVVSGHLNGLIGALIFDVLISPYEDSNLIIFTIMYALNVLIQMTLITVVYTIKDLTIISSIRGMVPNLIGTDASPEFDRMAALSIVSAPREMAKNVDHHLKASTIKGTAKGLKEKSKSVGGAAKAVGERFRRKEGDDS